MQANASFCFQTITLFPSLLLLCFPTSLKALFGSLHLASGYHYVCMYYRLTEKRKQWIKEIHARNRCNRATETKQRLWCSVVELRGIWHMQRCDFCPLASHCFLPAKWKHLCVQPWWLLSTAVTLNSGSCHPTPRGRGGCALMMWLELANCEPQPVHCRQTVPRGVPRRSETFGSVSAWKFVLLSKVKKKSTSSRLSDSTM